MSTIPAQGGDQIAEKPRPEQPGESVQMEIIKTKDVQDSSLPTPAIPSQSADPSAPAAAITTMTGESKGKEKDEQAAAPTPLDKNKEDDSLSIEPTDATPPLGNPEHPLCSITLLLPTGARHPYRLDEKYLAKRNVEVPDTTDTGKKDPFSISVYTLKELILREWRDEWDGKPASPSSIRLIHFGKLLDDKEQLKKYQFSADIPNVVHMSVKPAEMMEEDEAGKGKSAGREGRNRDGASRCCVIL